jgi:predicted phage terminase large subunit-like protein
MTYNLARDADKVKRLTGQEMREFSGVTAPSRPKISLSPKLVEAFVDKYLHERFDGSVPTPEFHREMWGLVTSPDRYVAAAAPRGHAKSTSITHAYTLTATLFRQRDFVLILSDTWSQAVEFLRDLKTELMNNEGIIKDFEVKRLSKDTEDDIIVVMRDNYTFRIVARGSEQKVRGLKWNNKRPNLVIGDDLEGDEQVESKLRRDKFFKWLMKAVLPCGSDDCLYRIVGTVMHFDSALERLLKDPTWVTRRYRAHKGFSDFSEILWPEKFSAERLKAIREKYVVQGESDGYSQEYLNEPIASGDAFFNPAYFTRMRPAEMEIRGVFYVGWDFAVSKSQRADFTVGTVWKVDSEGRKYVVDCRRGRWDLKEIIDEMMAVEVGYNPRAHFAEKGTIDNALGPFLDTEMMRRQTYLNLVKIASTKDKETRAKPLQGMLRSLHIKFNHDMPHWPDMEEELRRFPKGGHDDMVDALSIVGQGLRDVTDAVSDEVYEEEEFFGRFGAQSSGRNQTTGY